MKFKAFPVEAQGPFILESQYDGCWWPGAVWRQDIGRHGIDLVILQYMLLPAPEALNQGQFNRNQKFELRYNVLKYCGTLSEVLNFEC